MKNALLRLREASPSLSAAEQQIARYITENPEEATLLTVRELAQRTFTSPSSVVRVCRSVGFDGYKELRHALVGELAALGDKGRHSEQEITAEDDIRDIVYKVTQKNIQSLTDSQKLLSPETVEQCAHLLDQCRSVLLFGLGSSLCVAHDTYLKFLRLNKPCLIVDDWHAQLISAQNATPQDVAIAFSYSGQTVEVITCMEALKKNGTPIIAITRYSPSRVAELADYNLYIAANESLFRNGAMSSRIAQLNVIDILYTAYARLHYEDTLRALTRTHIYKPGEPEDSAP
ncbi:MurR/RpiR family transcriptional regulator [Faecalibacterium sp. An122]|uniref:MurR/RpiR family transcriptional regulator n=1 Tax=Faecalibacterium sp. An122 TaxID=1965551 RepID=UPI000B393E6A|nr:MurR/RpiR family transcriptional regulator [Faecalibacterium sp. An122]OUQ39777.1 RpiR family transcriptional regulator [Faecalibacterium sp. An122]